MKQTYDELVEKIVEKSGVSRTDVEEKINAKLKQLSGLISKEGAAHIVANQLGIKLVEQASGKLQLKGIMPGLRDVETLGKVVQIFPARTFQVQERTGQVASLTIADETASIRLVLWGDQCKHLDNLKLGDIVKVKSAYVKDQNSALELHLGNRGILIINPPGETLGEVKFEAQPAGQPAREFQRRKLSELVEGEDRVEVLGTIVQVFEPRFYEVCPQCGRRAQQQNGAFYCDTHSTITPAYSYVVNLFLDDGSASVRVVCFRNQALQVMGITDEEILKFKDSLDGFEAVRTAVLGNITKFMGKSVKNKMFDRIEFIANQVDMNPDPQKEMELLQKEIAAKANP